MPKSQVILTIGYLSLNSNHNKDQPSTVHYYSPKGLRETLNKHKINKNHQGALVTTKPYFTLHIVHASVEIDFQNEAPLGLGELTEQMSRWSLTVV